MSNSYLKQFSTMSTPQSEPILGSTQVPNSAGGFAWPVTNWTRLERFLILGAEGGTYYISERKLVKENALAVMACLDEDGPRTVDVIREVSLAGRAPKNDPAIFALAMASGHRDEATRRAALNALPDVCRIGTHLFTFLEFVKQFRGHGRALNRALRNWYLEKDPYQAAYQVVKYRQRGGWSHRDVIRKARPVGRDYPMHNHIFEFLMTNVVHGDAPTPLVAYAKASKATTPKEIVDLLDEYGAAVPREIVPTDLLNSVEVWEALLYKGGKYGMPITALIRNLPTMTKLGLLTSTSKATDKVTDMLTAEALLRDARVHPIQMLAALLTYKSGRSARGSAEWSPVTRIVDALDEGFYKAFGNVEPSGARTLVALDVSGSMMSGWIAGIPGLTPRVGSAAMAMVTMATGDPYEVVGFTSGAGGMGWRANAELTELTLSPRQRLDDVVRTVSGLPFGGTDCALPMRWAEERGKEFDAFLVYTDSETWAGSIHPTQALRSYRQSSGIPAKLVVVGMTSNGFSIADPDDAGMMDVVGFDTAAPQVMSDFIRV